MVAQVEMVHAVHVIVSGIVHPALVKRMNVKATAGEMKREFSSVWVYALLTEKEAGWELAGDLVIWVDESAACFRHWTPVRSRSSYQK